MHPERGNERGDGEVDLSAEEFDPDDPSVQAEVGERLLARAAQLRESANLALIQYNDLKTWLS